MGEGGKKERSRCGGLGSPGRLDPAEVFQGGLAGTSTSPAASPVEGGHTWLSPALVFRHVFEPEWLQSLCEVDLRAGLVL